jgi:8-oxo-dGTP diphosphatase
MRLRISKNSNCSKRRKMSHTKYDYPKPSVTVDTIVICNREILLVKRAKDPFKNCWVFPGGFIEMDETLEQSAIRELFEETGVKVSKVKQFATYGDPGRDPRDRVITVVHSVFIGTKPKLKRQKEECKEVKWWPLLQTPPLGFDHQRILNNFCPVCPVSTSRARAKTGLVKLSPRCVTT